MIKEIAPPLFSLPWQAEILAIALGLTVGTLVSRCESASDTENSILGVLILTALIGGAAVACRPVLLNKPSSAFALGGQLGLKAGFRATLFAGALWCFWATTLALSAVSVAQETQLKEKMWLTLWVALAALLPSVFCGFLGGAVAARLVRSRIPSGGEHYMVSHAAWWKWPSRLLTSISILMLASPLVFLKRQPKVDPPPVVLPKPLPTPVKPPPPFRYEVPAKLGDAAFDGFKVRFQKTLDGVVDGKAMSLSPEARLFAFCSLKGGSEAIQVLDLHTLTEVAHFSVPAHPAKSLVWSPDQTQLACLCAEGSSSTALWILSLKSGRGVALPRPKNGDLPEGDFFWWAADELAFFPSDEPPLVLKLDDLMLIPIEESKFFADLTEPEQKRWREGPQVKAPSSSSWTLGVAAGIRSTQPPPRNKAGVSWQSRHEVFCAFADPHSPRRHLLTDLPVSLGMKVLCAPDGSKIIRAANGQASVAYLEAVRPAEDLLTVDMPVSRDDLDGAGVSLVENSRLCALVYAPLVNPLNGKTVGPDYGHVKALLRPVEWKTDQAVFRKLHGVDSIQATDVVATLHTWEDGSLVPWRHGDFDEWWALAGVSRQADTEGSVVASLAPVEFPEAWELQASGTSHSVGKSSRPFVRSVSEGEVRAFLVEHHHKAAQGNFFGVAYDYADSVDFLDKGKIGKEQIIAEEIAHRERWPQSDEAIQGDIRLSRDGSLWTASYTLKFRNENNAGKWQTGLADLTLGVIDSSGALLIVSQKALVRDVQEGGSSSTPSRVELPKSKLPAIKIRLTSPVWAGSTTSSLGTETLEVHEAVSFKNGRAVLHRTYRVRVGPQTPKSVAAKFPNGLISLMTAEIEGSLTQTGPQTVEMYCGVQGWLQTPDAKSGEFNGLCGRDAERTVGTVLSFRFEGEDLIGGRDGIQMKLVK